MIHQITIIQIVRASPDYLYIESQLKLLIGSFIAMNYQCVEHEHVDRDQE